MAGPLTGIKVIDLTAVIAGPFSTMILGDLGATIIKIEPLRGDDSRHLGPPFQQGTGHPFLGLNRNKHSLALDLKHPEAVEIITRLATTADVFIQSTRPGTMQRLGLDYPTLRQHNPRLIYCSNSPYGTAGPLHDQAGYELAIQGYAGLMYRGDDPPQRERQSIVDISTGMTIVYSVLAALYARERTGQGQCVETSLLGAIMSVQAGRFVSGPDSTSTSVERVGSSATYRTYKTQDDWIIIAVLNDNLFRRLCQALQHPEWQQDERFRTHALRIAHEQELTALISATLSQQSAEIWLARLQAEGVPCSPIQRLDALFNDPQIVANHLVADIEHPQIGTFKAYGIGPKFSETPASIRMPPPGLGQHTEMILTELGYNAETIAALQARGVIARE